MHPALSVIFFTAVSGAGYGLLFLLGFILVADPHLYSRVQTLAMLATGSVFAIAGLISSLFHLGQPQRAWRAFSQWRSSWLSREGVASSLSFVPVVALAFFLLRDGGGGLLRALGAALATTAIVTIFCTSKIYTSLKTIHAWHNGLVLPGYLLLGLLGGATLLWTLSSLAGEMTQLSRFGFPVLVSLLAVTCAALKRSYWHFIDTTRHPATVESATGLGRFGAVRSVEAPHTEENYLTREMGFALARKHSVKLRGIALILFGVAPIVFAITALIWPNAGYLGACLAFVTTIAGTFVERWLFFAEAKHVVMLYYGAARA
jgi:DMSO reductase anchor subunit